MSELPALEFEGLEPVTVPTAELLAPTTDPVLAPDNALLRTGDLAVINRQSVNCRAWMSSHAPVNDVLRRGNKVELLRDPETADRRAWVKVRSVVKGIEGFLPLAYLDVRELRGQIQPAGRELPVQAGADPRVGDRFATAVRVNLRVAPGLDSGIMRSLDANISGIVLGGQVEIDGIGWIEARIGEETGWLANQFTRRISSGDKWIEVDISSQTVTAWNDSVAIANSPASTGKPGFRTPSGVHTISTKIPVRRLVHTAGGESWNIPGVPWIMVFREGGFYIHAVYWHDDFGAAVSHGCVTLPVPFAEWLYDWTPPGTRIWIHE